jgi:hypothetical protein
VAARGSKEIRGPGVGIEERGIEKPRRKEALGSGYAEPAVRGREEHLKILDTGQEIALSTVRVTLVIGLSWGLD